MPQDSPSPPSPADHRRFSGGGGLDAAESLFRTKPISEIRTVESTTRKQIKDKSEELRQLVGTRYRDLIDSADSIVLMKSSCESISRNISSVHDSILRSLSSSTTPKLSSNPNPNRARTYGIACRVKYLVETPEIIWGCLDESMFVEAASRYIRARLVHYTLVNNNNNNSNDNKNKNILSNFPLLQHQWQIVESFKGQISQRSKERLLDQTPGLGIAAYTDALAAVAIIDELEPKQVLALFLDSRRSCICQKLVTCDAISAFCEVLRIIQVSIGQVGELFLQVLNDMPLFYKVILATPPASQLFGSIPNPDEEVRSWKSFRDKLESVMVMLDRDFVAATCSDWLKNCGKEIVNKVNGRYLIDSIGSGRELASAEKLIRETMDSKQVLEGSLEWLKSVFGSEIELPWKRIRELVLGDDANLWDEIFEDAFVQRMKAIVDTGYDDLTRVVEVTESIHAIAEAPGDGRGFQAYLNRSYLGGGVWFMESNNKKAVPFTGSRALPGENDLSSCLNTYFGAEVSRIRDAIDSCCESVLEDLLSFLESPKAALRLKDLGPYLQNKCYRSISAILMELKKEIEHLSAALGNSKRDGQSVLSPGTIVDRALFIGRVLFAFQKHSRHIPVILGSPRLWVNETTDAVSGNSDSFVRQYSVMVDSPRSGSSGKKKFDSSKRQTSLANTALFGVDDSSSPQLVELINIARDLTIRAHNLWISWVSDELSEILSHDLRQDDGLSTTSIMRHIIAASGTCHSLNSSSWRNRAQVLEILDSPYADLVELCILDRDRMNHIRYCFIHRKLPLLLLSSEESPEEHTRGWEDTVVKQEQSDESQSEMKISLPALPSLYITSFLFQACEEIHRVGGHVLDKQILQKFALTLLEKVIGIYADFLSTAEARDSQMSDKGVLQVLLDLRFVADVLSGGDSSSIEELSKNAKFKVSFRRKQDVNQTKSAIREQVDGLVNRLSQKLDPIDWLTYEPYLWENERQSYLRHAVLFGFFVQLNRLYTDTVQKLPTNSESNIMRCSTVPSAPALSSRGTTKASASPSMDDVSSRSSWKNYANEDLSRNINIDDDSSFGVATPFLKSFMQFWVELMSAEMKNAPKPASYSLGVVTVGSRFGELGSILTDGQVGRFKDKSAAAMSTFGDILPVQAAGLLSSFTASRSDS
ncbi:hypothetical protein RHSIM_Rhsim04G0086300 [Rhododendron simsii]|uniref:Conserved oligomeric Golgi complex subunit 1 n=1 Tax=Rhododendron simsii TaxID=118357 RepID=A0A834H7B1_RHOSS|nr:hypothetical protein RHSIM_Rhsim04G0086300 [Rhododendron simsii]